jgi:ribosomal protein L11 methyltransferase
MTGHKEQIFQFVKNYSEKLTLKDIACEFGGKKLSYREIKQIIKDLINEGLVEYSYELGNSFISPSFNNYVQISDSIIVHPPELLPKEEKKGFFYIKIEKSTSFGRGNHPTTRLCLLAMEKALQNKDLNKNGFFDLGCGTAILAVAAAYFGFESCFAVDIDPVALFDAKTNVKINGFESKISVDSFWPQNTKFSIIAANLRPLTLVEFKNDIKNRLEKKGYLVLSGFKSDEKNWLLKYFKEFFFVKDIWEEKGWCSALLQYNG